MKLHKLLWMAWPAFLVAGLIEILVFALVDPQDLHWFGQQLPLSRQGVYTLAFFAFWGLTLCACGLTLTLALSPAEVNQQAGPFSDARGTLGD